jgi:hypothetical protein
MTYDPTIPSPESSPSTSASPTQVNFSQFAAIFSNLVGGINYNHGPMNSSSQGKHAAVIMQSQTTDPGVSQNLDVLYAKNAPAATSGPQPQIFLQIPKFLPIPQDTTPAQNLPMQLTYNSVNTTGPQYQSFLPGGYIMYFGTISSSGTVTLVPTPTEVLMAQAFSQGAFGGIPDDASVTVDNINHPNQVVINSFSSPSSPLLYLVIAKA